jgi:transposase
VVRYRRDATGDTSVGNPAGRQPQCSRCGVSSFRITAALREAFSTITLVWADAGYAGRFVRDARKIWDLAVAIVKRPDQAKGFVLLHRRWVVERSFAWLTKFRRLVRDDETLPATHEAMIWTAATWQLSNRLTR